MREGSNHYIIFWRDCCCPCGTVSVHNVVLNPKPYSSWLLLNSVIILMKRDPQSTFKIGFDT